MVLHVQLLLLAKLLFSSYFYLAYCLVYDWLTDCLRDAFVGAYVLREYREIRTRVRAACSSTCWSTLLYDEDLSAVTLSTTTWWRTIPGQDGDRLYSVVIPTTGCWIHLHEQSTIFTTFCGWRYSDGGWKKSTILRAHYAGRFTYFNSTSRSSWFKVVGLGSLTSAIPRRSDRRKSGIYSSPELRRSSRCRSS